MPINNYLVIGVNPANNETQVPTDKEIRVAFAKHMDQSTLTSSTLLLKGMDGAAVTYALTYDSVKMEAILKPNSPLLPGKQYQLVIDGSVLGIKSITGDYMTTKRTYSFTTSHEVALSPPTQVKVQVEDGYPSVSWERPTDYDIGKTLKYEVKISNYPDPLQPALWPATGDVGITEGLSINVPKKLTEGRYYAMVKALSDGDESDWTEPLEFNVAGEKKDEEEDEVAPPTLPDVPLFNFYVTDHSPKNGDVNVLPNKIMIVFSDVVNMDTATSETIYILEKQGKEALSSLDLLSDYSPTNAIATKIHSETGNILSLEVELKEDKEYTVIVTGDIESASGVKTGNVYSFSFLSKLSRLYGDPEAVRATVSSYMEGLTTRVLYRAMARHSEHAYAVVSGARNFLASNYEDGKAPYYVHQYVTMKTTYELILSGYIKKSSSNGESVTLGDLSVRREEATTGISTILRELKAELKGLEDLLHGYSGRGYATMKSVVKAETTADPDFLTRSEFRDLGE